MLCFLGEFEDALKNLLKAKKYFEEYAEIEYRLCALYFNFKNETKGAVHLINALFIDFDYKSILKELFPEVYNMNQVQVIINDFKKNSL